jgi:hypothetical protein
VIDLEACDSRPIRVFGTEAPAIQNGGSTGLVVVAPATMMKDQLADTKHLLRVSPAPLLGVIVLGRPARPRRGLRGLRSS